MSLTMTTTEFNRSRSHAVRVARGGEDVFIVSARGGSRDALVLTRADKAANPIDHAIATGRMTRPRLDAAAPFATADVDPGIGARALAEFEESRAIDA